tara:strand:+ start:261 stop:680 length:420 start_codon:yes stop_codon:yes gene_type:complete
MTNEQDSIDKINPFVVREFSLPGGIRQTDRTEIAEYYSKDAFARNRPSDAEQRLLDKVGVSRIHETKKSPFCAKNLCAMQAEQDVMNKVIHPKYNIDYGVACRRKPKIVSMGVSNKIPDSMYVAVVAIILFALVFALRR